MVDEYGDSYNTGSLPFQSKLWSVRAAVQRGYEALFTVQELQHILNSQSETSPNWAQYVNEVSGEMGRAVRLLCHAIGINTIVKFTADGQDTAGVEIILDGALLSALVQAAKGKKLLTRSISYLSPAQR
jgi:hypothetical protein